MRPLGFFRQFFYMYFLANMPGYVLGWNLGYSIQGFSALVLNSILMWWTYPIFLIYQFLRGRSLRYDWEELEEKNKVFNIKQGLTYHYWGDSRYQTLLSSYITHVKDFWVGVLGFIPFIFTSIGALAMMAYDFLYTWTGFGLFWEGFTFWDQDLHETFALYFSKAPRKGVYDYERMYASRFLIQEVADELERKIQKKLCKKDNDCKWDDIKDQYN